MGEMKVERSVGMVIEALTRRKAQKGQTTSHTASRGRHFKRPIMD